MTSWTNSIESPPNGNGRRGAGACDGRAGEERSRRPGAAAGASGARRRSAVARGRGRAPRGSRARLPPIRPADPEARASRGIGAGRPHDRPVGRLRRRDDGWSPGSLPSGRPARTTCGGPGGRRSATRRATGRGRVARPVRPVDRAERVRGSGRRRRAGAPGPPRPTRGRRARPGLRAAGHPGRPGGRGRPRGRRGARGLGLGRRARRRSA